MQTITVGKKRNVTFTLYDQNGNPNPVDSKGNPLELVSPSFRLDSCIPPDGFDLSPAVDGKSCYVTAIVGGATAILCYSGLNSEGAVIEGSDNLEAIAKTNAAVIKSLSLQFSDEVDADPVFLGLRIEATS